MLLKELINEVNAIGNNINQITRNYNSKLYRTEDRELLCAYMKKLNLTVKEAADKICDLVDVVADGIDLVNQLFQ